MLRRAHLGLLALSLALGLPLTSCDKSDSGTSTPGGKGGAKGGGATSGDTMRYDLAAKTIKQKTVYEFTLSGGGQYGELKASLAGTINLEPMGKDKLTLAWKVDEVSSIELKGVLKPKQEEGQPPPPDVKKVLLEKGTGSSVVDLRGETDEDATKALPANEKRRKEREARRAAMEAAQEEADKKDGEEPAVSDEVRTAAAEDQILGLFASVFQVPTLPEQGLEIGKPLTLEEEDEVDLPTGTKLPIESETIYTLVRIDDSSGKKIAEVEVEIEASGATEFQGGMLVVDQSTEATILFNMTDGLPVAMNITTSQSFTVGEQGQEVTTIIQSEFEAV